MYVECVHTCTMPCVEVREQLLGSWFFPYAVINAGSILLLFLDRSSRLAGLRASDDFLVSLCLRSHLMSEGWDCRLTLLHPGSLACELLMGFLVSGSHLTIRAECWDRLCSEFVSGFCGSSSGSQAWLIRTWAFTY